MPKINAKRLGTSGLVASIVLFVLTGILNGALLAGPMQEWMQRVSGLHPPAPPVSMILWTLMSLIIGFGGVWLYAAIRPHFGPGPKTALLAGLFVWIVSKLTAACDLLALGLIPEPIVGAQLAGSFVAIFLAVFLGAWLYRE